MSVTTVTDTTFQKEVIEASDHKLVVVEFSTKEKVNKRGLENASAKMDAVFNKLADDYINRVVFARVEIELDPDLKDSLNPLTSAAHAINHGPTMVFFKKGQKVRDDLVGLQTDVRTTQILDELLSTS
ncbi:thioredoxin [Pseudomonas syringae]|uniref:Thioredoxin n=2 Tax=Pseudomonas syringae TaxID=317 RepID=A0A244EJF0_PSESX|nr:thioredoxin [Pseudomonas syringae]